ncbi:MAG: hypothetical protein J6B04_05935 [Clostridia bacterium]|nr:hypothetical protein [Clostridia bacterium]
MDKVIVKTAIKTVLIILAVCIGAFAILSFAMPSQMATWCEKSGNYSLALKYANLQYGYSNDINDLSRVVENAVYSEDSKNIIKYGEKLVLDDSFNDLCKEKNEYYANGEYGELKLDYKQFICGELSIAYAKEGQEDKAVERAFTANGENTFKKPNALISLSVYAATQNNLQLSQKLTEKLNQIKPNLDENGEDYATLCDVLEILADVK